MFGRRTAVACGSVLAMCAAPVGAAERYADFRYTVEVTGQHFTKNSNGDTETINKNRRYDGRVRLRHMGTYDATTPLSNVAVVKLPKAPANPMAPGGAGYMAKMMACQQKSANEAEAEACMIEVATAGPAGDRIKHCLAKSEAERNKDPMCGGGGRNGGEAPERDNPQPSRQVAQIESWIADDCEGNLVVNDTGSQHIAVDTVGGSVDSPMATTGNWSVSAKRDPVAITKCSAMVNVNTTTGETEIHMSLGESLIPVAQKLGTLTTKTTIHPFDWSSAQLNGNSLVIKKAARNGSPRQFSGNWTHSGTPSAQAGKQSTPNNRFTSTTTARWTFSAK